VWRLLFVLCCRVAAAAPLLRVLEPLCCVPCCSTSGAACSGVWRVQPAGCLLSQLQTCFARVLPLPGSSELFFLCEAVGLA